MKWDVSPYQNTVMEYAKTLLAQDSPSGFTNRAVDAAEALARGLEKLPDWQRQVLVLRELSGLSYQEIGQALSLDIGTVKSRIARARLSLRKILLESGNLSGYLPSNRTKGSDGEEGR